MSNSYSTINSLLLSKNYSSIMKSCLEIGPKTCFKPYLNFSQIEKYYCWKSGIEKYYCWKSGMFSNLVPEPFKWLAQTFSQFFWDPLCIDCYVVILVRWWYFFLVYLGKTYEEYLAVPFAAPPGRWEMPKPPEPWEGVRDATGLYYF